MWFEVALFTRNSSEGADLSFVCSRSELALTGLNTRPHGTEEFTTSVIDKDPSFQHDNDEIVISESEGRVQILRTSPLRLRQKAKQPTNWCWYIVYE